MTPAPVRPDGRADEHARALVVALDVVTHAAGSAYVELGDTKVSCAVYGPRQHRGGDAPARVDRGALEVDVHAAPFAGKTAGSASTYPLHEMETVHSCASDSFVSFLHPRRRP